MNPIISYIATHLLTVIENEIISNAPEIAQYLENEIELLINRLQSMLAKSKASSASKSAAPAQVVQGMTVSPLPNPTITNVS